MDFTRRTFSIDSCLGRGGFGEVYRAEMTSSTGLSTAVALKVLRRDLAPGGQAVQRLKDEAKALAALNHPAILRVYDLVVLEGRAALITEFVEGEDLERCLRGDERISLRALAEVLARVAAALHAAYTSPIGEGGAPLKLVHRDVKPSNIRLGLHGDVKLLDFGIARSDEVTREARTQTDTMVGSPPYMAPERFLEPLPHPASDVFSMGCVLLEAIIGLRAFDLPVTMLASLAVDAKRFERHLAERMGRVPPTAPEPAVELAREMLRFSPDDRPSAAEVAKRLDLLADQIDGVTFARFCRDRRWSEPIHESGELLGRVMTEGSLERPTTDGFLADAPAPAEPPRPATSAPRRRGLLVWIGGFGVLTVGMVAGAAALAAAATFGVWWAQLPAPVPAPVPAPIERPAPPAAPQQSVPTPPPTPTAAPVVPVAGPVPKIRPVPAPPGVEPAPTPVAPTPTTSPAPTQQSGVWVGFEGADAVTLIGSGAPIRLPARVEPGKYDVDIQFSLDNVVHGTVAVKAGGDQLLSCKERMKLCR